VSQVTHGARALLSSSRIYDLFQEIMGSRMARTIFSAEYVRAKPGDAVLDIGCGTAELLRYLPSVEYHGFDPDPRYIDTARKKFRARPHCTFTCAIIDEKLVGALPKFDIVLMIGVLHHLDDEEASHLAALAKAALKGTGRLVSLDPCLVEGQSAIARFLAKHDRGQHVRQREDYRTLMSAIFPSIATEIRHDLGRIPYTHLIMQCRPSP
jgi:SAM-dependent methyltransferase